MGVFSGREREVTPVTLPSYICKYSEYRMVKSQKKALDNLKDGKYIFFTSLFCMRIINIECLNFRGTYLLLGDFLIVKNCVCFMLILGLGKTKNRISRY